MTKFLRWYLLLVFVASAGCDSAPMNYSNVLNLKSVTVLDEITQQVGHGSCFAVSDRVLLTAAHCVDTFSHLEINGGYTLDVKKVQAFGEDGAILTVAKLPAWVKIYNIADTHIRNAAIQCSGYNPVTGEVKVAEGVITSPIATSALIVNGMSGGPATVNGVAVGINSAYILNLGISILEPIDVELVRKAIKEAANE